MQKELQDLQPILARTAKEVEEMMVVITNDKREADETKRSVEIQEKEANEQVGGGGGACQEMSACLESITLYPTSLSQHVSHPSDRLSAPRTC